MSQSPLRLGFLLVPLALGCFALSQTAQAQDGDELNHNTAEGDGALHTYILTASSASDDTAIGFSALFSNTTGGANTATGSEALASNTSGMLNTASGASALFFNTTGSNNTATGVEALGHNNADNNTANGFEALMGNTTGHFNMASGASALVSNSTGSYNTAIGALALNASNADSNTAIGVNALLHSTTGVDNTATGVDALEANITGHDNTAIGYFALNKNKTGAFNIALGNFAGQNLTTGSNNIDIGNVGVAGESAHIRIGTKGTQTNTFIAGIHGVPVVSALQVVVDVNGHLGTVGSSERFKEAIKPMDKASEAILNLKPVTFHYKEELDPNKIPQFGLIAEEVEKVSPDLVVRGEDGKVMTVRYEAVNAMLLNEFLKEHRKVEKQDATIAWQQKEIAALAAQLKEQAALIHKVSDQLELSKAAPQIAASN